MCNYVKNVDLINARAQPSPNLMAKSNESQSGMND